jgi:hypothetical protein
MESEISILQARIRTVYIIHVLATLSPSSNTRMSVQHPVAAMHPFARSPDGTFVLIVTIAMPPPAIYSKNTVLNRIASSRTVVN